MKYRIVKRKEFFYVQRKVALLWKNWIWQGCGECAWQKAFDSIDEAKIAAEKAVAYLRLPDEDVVYENEVDI